MDHPTSPRWRALWTRLGATGDPEPPHRDLLARYAEPHRAYHTIAHIAHCLAELETVRAAARDADAVELALWFHDAVYDPRAKDSEERSALLLLETARAAGIPAERAGRIAAMIRASTHRSLSEDADTRLFADIDLAILGQAPEAFDRYEVDVRKEYDFVPEPAFRAGRGSILRAFLARPALYGTELFRNKYEAAARANLDRSLGRLS